MILLTINNLRASVAGKPILNGLSLTVPAGEIHAIMGPNGAGKSTLAYVLGGRPGYEVTGGSVQFTPTRHPSERGGRAQTEKVDSCVRGKDVDEAIDLLSLAPHERAAAGLFLGFQYPVEIPGVSNMTLLKAAMNARRKHRGEPEIPPTDFLAWVRDRPTFRVPNSSSSRAPRRPRSGWTPTCSSARSMSASRAVKKSALKWFRWAL
ncbi:MAG: hypothetical protein NVS3B5_18600 [Sphingomicrobium sp.]